MERQICPYETPCLWRENGVCKGNWYLFANCGGKEEEETEE